MIKLHNDNIVREINCSDESSTEVTLTDTDSEVEFDAKIQKVESEMEPNPLPKVRGDNEENEVHTLNTITMIDGSTVTIKGNTDKSHVSPEVLNRLSVTDRKKMVFHQAYIDYNLCLERDKDGYLPLHCAVLNKDMESLKRQCVVLKIRHESVDIPTYGNMTAFQMSIKHDSAQCADILLQHGADPVILNEEAQTPLHLAAEVSSELVQVLINHYKAHARNILKNNKHLCQPQLENKTDIDLATNLLTKMCSTFDNQGNTPLMIASRMARYESVRLLLEAAPTSVNLMMPTCGNTALYITVGAAFLDRTERGDKNKSDFIKTIDCLVKNGADPDITNCTGNNVIKFLHQNFADISTLIASKIVKHGGENEKCGEHKLTTDNTGNDNIEMKSKKVDKNEIRKTEEATKNTDGTDTNGTCIKKQINNEVSKTDLTNSKEQRQECICIKKSLYDKTLQKLEIISTQQQKSEKDLQVIINYVRKSMEETCQKLDNLTRKFEQFETSGPKISRISVKSEGFYEGWELYHVIITSNEYVARNDFFEILLKIEYIFFSKVDRKDEIMELLTSIKKYRVSKYERFPSDGDNQYVNINTTVISTSIYNMTRALTLKRTYNECDVASVKRNFDANLRILKNQIEGHGYLYDRASFEKAYSLTWVEEDN